MIEQFAVLAPISSELDRPATTITTIARAGTTVAEAIDAAVARSPRKPIPLPERVWVPPVVSVEHGRALNWIRIAIRWAAYEGAFLKLLREAGFFSRKRLTAIAFITGQQWARIPGDAPINTTESKAA